MRIAWSGQHTPYAYMFMRAFPEFQFTVDGWNKYLRPLPENAVKADFSGTYDAAITDHLDLVSTQGVNARRTVFIDHNEYGHPIEAAMDVLDRVDAFVCVSEHKLWTHRELCFSPKAHWVWFCFDEEMFPKRRYDLSGRVGFVHNGIQGEMAMVANGVLFGMDAVGIGHHNEAYMGKRVSPENMESFLGETGSLAAAINIVNGDSCGMSPLELMAQGVPVVFGLSADLPRFLFSGYNCFITRNRAVDSMTEMREYLKRLTEDQSLNQSMGEAARKSVLREMSVQGFREKWAKVLGGMPCLDYLKQQYDDAALYIWNST